MESYNVNGGMEIEKLAPIIWPKSLPKLTKNKIMKLLEFIGGSQTIIHVQIHNC